MASVQIVLEHVAWEFGVTVEDIIGDSHRQWLSIARYAVVWLSRRNTTSSGAEIAEAMRCHIQSTVWWHRRARDLIASSADARSLFEDIDHMLASLAAPSTIGAYA